MYLYVEIDVERDASFAVHSWVSDKEPDDEQRYDISIGVLKCYQRTHAGFVELTKNLMWFEVERK